MNIGETMHHHDERPSEMLTPRYALPVDDEDDDLEDDDLEDEDEEDEDDEEEEEEGWQVA